MVRHRVRSAGIRLAAGNVRSEVLQIGPTDYGLWTSSGVELSGPRPADI